LPTQSERKGGILLGFHFAWNVFPLAKFALKSHALGNLKRRDDASLDLLAGLSGGFA
jgi:hypothetical protein